MEQPQDHHLKFPPARLLAHLDVTRQLCESAILKFEDNPQDMAPLATIETSLGVIQQSLAFNHFELLSDLTIGLEAIILAVQSGSIQYHPMITDIVLLSLECIRSNTPMLADEQPSDIAEERLMQTIASLQIILHSRPAQHESAMRTAMMVLDPSTQIEYIELQNPTAPQNKPEPVHDSLSQLFSHYGVTPSADLDFFKSLIAPIEARSQYWQGRSERILRLALKMNHHARQPVDPTQLAAAVYMHDISMAFLPLDILHKKERLNNREKRILNGHARSSYEMLHRMIHWEEAAEMILQHHEHMAGGGYPKGLTEAEICDGAKIIAIVDTFDARTHERAHTTLQRRPFVRALLEINGEAGNQFSQYWVDIFNHVIRNPDETVLYSIES